MCAVCSLRIQLFVMCAVCSLRIQLFVLLRKWINKV